MTESYSYSSGIGHLLILLLAVVSAEKEQTFVGSCASRSKSWLMIASAIKSFTCSMRLNESTLRQKV